MSIIAAAVKHMLAAGMPHEAIVAAVEAMEAEAPKVSEKTARQERNRRYYERRKASESRLKTSDSDEQDANKTRSDDADGSPRAPSRSNINLPSGDIKNLPSEGKKTTGVVHALPLNEAFDAWDQTAKRCGLPTIRSRTSQRTRHLQARLKANGLDGWIEALSIVEKSAFLTGQNGRGWRADFDFVVKSENFAKILEGSYARPGDKPKPASVAPKMPETDEQWARTVHLCRLQHQWPAYLGPAPDMDGCKAPAHLLTPKDRREYWRIMQVAS